MPDRGKTFGSFWWRLAVSAIALALWFWTQHLLGMRAATIGINDALQNLFAGLNSYFSQAPLAANVLLIVSSALIDALGLFLIARWIFAGMLRPFLGLVLLLALRQVMEVLCALPTPPHMIWHYPGFPSLLVTYRIGNDFFFSGHTAIAVFGAMELTRLRRQWLTVLAWLVVAFEVATVLILRAHYTMDVFTGALAALWVWSLCHSASPHLNRWLLSAETPPPSSASAVMEKVRKTSIRASDPKRTGPA